jgi:hypothetical protein
MSIQSGREAEMYRLLNIIAIIAGVVMGFIGAWGVIESISAGATSEAENEVIWIALALLAGGIGLVASGLARILPAVR